MLGKTLTLIESNLNEHQALAQNILRDLHPLTGKSIRIGITGSPGVGKSTFIDALGEYLCNNGRKVAVLAIDPSSSRSRGSILGDKTRMEKLSVNRNAFIRPSPSGGISGGVARKTRESILICEAAGYDVILVETIGVGQSEIAVRSMVDLFTVLIAPGGGDELQGFKKGTVELSDIILINKDDGENRRQAEITRSSYEHAIHFLMPATEGWTTKILTVSAIESRGMDGFWGKVEEFEKITKESGEFEKRRQSQLLDWVNTMIDEQLKQSFYSNPKIKKLKSKLENEVLTGKTTPVEAVNKMIKEWDIKR